MELYIRSAVPVGSEVLLSESDLSVSGATLRNEMRDLEDLGFLTHPHTSAGRIPTEMGYRYYVDTLMSVVPPSKSFLADMRAITKKETDEDVRKKTIARAVSAEVNAAVVIVHGHTSVYYTGLSQMFAQPEFAESAQAISLSSIFDHFDDHAHSLLSCLSGGRGVTVRIGSENPLGAATSIVGVCLDGESAFLIFGPTRLA